MGLGKTAALLSLGLGLLGAGFFLGGIVNRPEPQVKTRFVVNLPAGTVQTFPTVPVGRVVEARSTPVRESLRAALEALPPLEIPSGDGVITGRVLTDDGEPLPGVEVRLTPAPPEDGPGARYPSAESEPDLAARAEAMLQYSRWWEVATRRTGTGADGAFRFEGLADTGHRVNLKKDGWLFTAAGNRTGEVRPGADLEYRARARARIRVRMRKPDGSEPEQGQVAFRSGSGSSSWGWNSRNPELQVDGGTFEVSASSGENREWSSEPRTITLVAGDPVVDLDFDLKGRPGIHGRVLFAEGVADGQPQVYFARIPANGEMDEAMLRAAGRGDGVRDHNGTFEFRFDDLLPGPHAVGAARDRNGPILVIERVQVGEGPAKVDLRLPAASRDDYVILHVRDRDGKAAPQARIQTSYRSPTGTSSGGSTVVKRPDGSLLVFHHSHPWKEDPEATYTISVSLEGLGDRSVEYSKGGPSEFTVRFEPPGAVRAKVTGHRGTPYENRLSFRLGAPDSPGSRSFGGSRRGGPSLTADGVQDLGRVQPGEYLLVLVLEAEPRGGPVGEKPVTVVSGDNEFSLALPILHTLSIHGAQGQVHLRREGDRYFMRFQQAAREDRILFDGLPDGEYKVQAGGETRTVVLPGTTEVRF